MVQQNGQNFLAHRGGAGILMILPQDVLVKVGHDESALVVGAEKLLEAISV